MRGKLKVVIEKDGERFETILTDRDLISVPPGVYREEINIGDEDALMCVMLGAKKPNTPTYPHLPAGQDQPLAPIKHEPRPHAIDNPAADRCTPTFRRNWPASKRASPRARARCAGGARGVGARMRQRAGALCCLHGIGSGAASWLERRWRLSRSARVIAWDAPGYGDSTPLRSAGAEGADYAAAPACDARRPGHRALRAGGPFAGRALPPASPSRSGPAHGSRIGRLVLDQPGPRLRRSLARRCSASSVRAKRLGHAGQAGHRRHGRASAAAGCCLRRPAGEQARAMGALEHGAPERRAATARPWNCCAATTCCADLPPADAGATWPAARSTCVTPPDRLRGALARPAACALELIADAGPCQLRGTARSRGRAAARRPCHLIESTRTNESIGDHERLRI